MDLSKLSRLLDLYEKEPGLAMPPIQVFATQFALSSSSYSTGLFKVLHGRPIIYLNHLVEKCVEKAQKLGMSVNEEFKHNVGNIPVDAPQAASLISDALNEFRMRYGSKHQAKIQQWIRESFDDLLPPSSLEIGSEAPRCLKKPPKTSTISKTVGSARLSTSRSSAFNPKAW